MPKPFTAHHFRRRVFGQLWMLALQFVLGMLLNILGSQAGDGPHALYRGLLLAHIINAIGLLEGGIYIAAKDRSQLAWGAALAIALTFTGGVLTVATKADGWSLAMAFGFLLSSWLYGVLYVRADRALR